LKFRDLDTQTYYCNESTKVAKKSHPELHCPMKFLITKEDNNYMLRGCAYHNHIVDNPSINVCKKTFSGFNDALDFLQEEGFTETFVQRDRRRDNKYAYYRCHRSSTFVAKIKTKKCGCPAYFSLAEGDNGKVTFSGNFEHNHDPDGSKVLSEEQVKEVTGLVKDGVSFDQILAHLGDNNPNATADVKNLQRFHAPWSIDWTGPNLTKITDLVKKQNILTNSMKLIYSSSSETENLLAAELSRMAKMGFHLQELERESGAVDYLLTLNGSHHGEPTMKCLILCEKCPGTNCDSEGQCTHLHISAAVISGTKGRKRKRSDTLKSEIGGLKLGEVEKII
jgi:hypothetical protein